MVESSVMIEEDGPLQEEAAGNNKRVVSSFIPLNKMSIRLRGMSVLRNIYSSTVEIPSYYTERKHNEYGTWKYILRKVSCIPFALLYGFVLAWIVSDFVLNKPDGGLKLSNITQKDTARNICAVILSGTVNHSNHVNPLANYSEMDVSNLIEDLDNWSRLNLYKYNASKISENYTSSHQVNEEGNGILYSSEDYIRNSTSMNFTDKWKGSIFFENDSPELYYFTGTFIGIIGITSILSRNTRGTMLLILPGLITRHSRKFIYTIILGFLANGPMNTLKYNFNRVLDNTACMYKSVTVAACLKRKKSNSMLEYAKDIHDTLEKIYELINKLRCSVTGIPLGQPCQIHNPPFRYQNTTWQSLKSMTAPTLSGIKLQASIVIEKLNILGHYVDIARKCLTVISIMLLIFDAVRYLRSYYTDSSFDNMYIGRSTRKFWKDKNYKTLTPLRHWEVNEGYKVMNLTKFKRKEFYKVLRNTLATFIFFIFVAVVFIADYLLANALQYIKDKQKFSISLEGVNKNLADYIIKLHNFEMKSCLSSPRYPSKKIYFVISLLLLAAAISCVLEVYMSRIRAHICNLFYPDRAEERADYLHYKIYTGRINRRYHLLLIIRREIERKIRLVRFSPLKRLTKFLCCTHTHEKRTIICPGCGWKVKYSKAKEVHFNVVKKEIKAMICQDCDLDILVGDKLSDMYESSF